MNKNSSESRQGHRGVPSAASKATSELKAYPSGVALIAAERERQVNEEGWTPEHDDHHAQQELAQAAACYAWPAPRPIEVKKAWPWGFQWWKPTVFGVGADWREISEARIRDLTKAGALLAAEIDRIQRLLAHNASVRNVNYASIVTEVPQLKRGRVWCIKCGATWEVSSATCLREGWPECCGETMTIDSPEERAALKTQVTSDESGSVQDS